MILCTKSLLCQSQGKFDNFRDFMPNLMVLQQAPAQVIIWGYVAECDPNFTATFAGEMCDLYNFNWYS